MLPSEGVPDLGGVGRRLAGFGITGVTDTTPYDRIDDLRPLVDAVRGGALPQRVAVTGSPSLASARFPEPLEVGPVKIVLEDHTPPPFDDLVGLDRVRPRVAVVQSPCIASRRPRWRWRSRRGTRRASARAIESSMVP